MILGVWFLLASRQLLKFWRRSVGLWRSAVGRGDCFLVGTGHQGTLENPKSTSVNGMGCSLVSACLNQDMMILYGLLTFSMASFF